MGQFNFSSLQPDDILHAIESVGIYVESGLLALNSYENRVYQFIDEHHKRMVVKFYRPQRWDQAQILEEHQFALQLDAQEVPLVPPLLINGHSLFEHQGYWFAIFPSVGGRLFEVDNLEHLEWMGRFIGRIHLVGQTQDFKHRPTMDPQDYLHHAADMLKHSHFVPNHLQTPFFTILEHVITAADQQLNAQHLHSIRKIRLHGDCHPGNILWTDAGPHFVDLDDARMGPAIQDLWMMLSGDRQNRLLQLDTLINGYEDFLPFDTNELALIEPLRAMRMVHYMAWLAKRWSDPAFPRHFAWFAEDRYWEGQILTLKEQLAVLQEPCLQLFPQ